jgi:hypothetical protein
MATRLRMTHLIHCDVANFWSSFRDDALNCRLFTSDLGYPAYRVSERTEQDGRLRRRIEITPKVSMPTPVKNILGDMFSYVEVGELQAAEYRFKLLPPAEFKSDRASSEGCMRAETTPEGWTQRSIELSIEVRMLGLGHMLESFALKAAEDLYAAHAKALNAHFDGRVRMDVS